MQLWHNLHGKQNHDYPQNVYNAVDAWVNRASQLSYTGENSDKGDMTPIVSVVINLIDQATNTQYLASMPEQFMPYF